MTKVITQPVIDKGMTYRQYRALIADLLAEGKVTGPNQGEFLTDYTRLNEKRMNRLDKTIVLSDELKAVADRITQPWVWLVITEGWCGDAAQIVPLFNKIAEYSDMISLRLILRDENPEVMDAFLTNGGKSIPILVCLEQNMLEVLGKWGPRPSTAQQMVLDFKENPSGSREEMVEKLHGWYAKDKTLTSQAELAETMEQWLRRG
ncbi:thioredoxin family protein [Roseivirga sp. BDSF3-8]|uniref:thioredoxin family protein n=1 Tax=Roseivirga sp. BDSF3-8 TaxID=3241598 RepID=UPI0035324C19